MIVPPRMRASNPERLATFRIVSALGITQIVSWGAIYYAISVLAQPISADTGWSPTLVFAGFSLSLLVGGLVAAPVGRFIDRRGGRLAMTLGSMVGALGLALVGLAPHPAIYLAAWVVLGLASRLTLYDAAFATLVEIMGQRARKAISGLTLFGGLASSVFWPLTHMVEHAVGWRATFLIYAALVLVLCGAIHAFLLPAPGAVPKEGASTAAGGAEEGLIPPRERAFAILLLATALALNSFIFTALSAHMIPMFAGMGLAAGTVVWIASLKGVFQTLGRFVELLHGHRIHPTTLAMIAVGILPLGFLALLPFGVTFEATIAFTVLYGVSNGLVTIVRGGLPLVLFGRVGYGAVLATIAMPGLFLTAAAPTLFAAAIDLAGTRLALLGLFVLSVLSFAATVILALRYRRG